VPITKSEGGHPGRLETVERLTKIVSLAAIPVILAVGGWAIQVQVQQQAVRRDYVQLAVSILKEPLDAGKNTALRGWAVHLLRDNSSTALSQELQKQLESGQAVLPNPEYLSGSRSVETLQPCAAEGARQLVSLAAKEGILVKIASTLRTGGEQDRYKAKGLAAVGSSGSKHVRGLAFDVAVVRGDDPVWDDKLTYARIGEIGKSLKLVWGGDWAFKDVQHFECVDAPTATGQTKE